MKQSDVAHIIDGDELDDNKTGLRYEQHRVSLTSDEETVYGVARLLGDSLTQLELYDTKEDAESRYKERSWTKNGVVALVKGEYRYYRRTGDRLRKVETLDFKGGWADE